VATEVSAERTDDESVRLSLLRSSIIARVKETYGEAKDRLQVALPIIEVLPFETENKWYSVYDILEKGLFPQEKGVYNKVQRGLYDMMGMSQDGILVVRFRREQKEDSPHIDFTYALRTNPNFESGKSDEES